MPLLIEYDRRLVVFNCFGDEEKAIIVMGKAITLYWPKRKNKIARSRIKSACKIIREIRNVHTDNKTPNAEASTRMMKRGLS